MLTKFDEFTCHQIVDTFDHPAQTDRAWTEKIWVHVHDTTGRLSLATGLGVYPNRNVLDAYGCLALDKKAQTNIRLSRELRPRIDELSVGPFAYDVKEPFKRIRIAMDKNDSGLSYDLEFLGRLEPGEEDPHQFWRDNGRISVNTRRYAQLGRAKGWIRLGDEKFEVNEDDYYAQRDHSWGVRMGVGAPETGVQMPDIGSFMGMMINWLTIQFQDWGLYLYYIETAEGETRLLSGKAVGPLEGGRETRRITAVDHDYVYHPKTAGMKSGVVGLTLDDGSELELSMNELTTMFLRGGGYLGYDGFFHGIWMGSDWSTHERWDLTDIEKVAQYHGLDDTVCEVRCGDEKGYGIVENIILPPFPRYGFKGRWQG